MTNKELRLTTINLFGKLYKQIRKKEILIIYDYILNHPLLPPLDNELVSKLYYHLNIDREKGCWLPEDWSYYGHVNKEPAHRLSYRLMIGPILPDRYICHDCDRKGCRNPFHLFQGTASDNIKDAIKKGRIFSIHIGKRY